MMPIKDKLSVRLDFSIEEAQALDHAMASALESPMMIFFMFDTNDELQAQARKGAMRLRQGIARATDPEYRMEKKREYVQREQEATRPHATNTWQPWTDEEKAFILESDLPITDIALTLGRTFRGVKEMRKKLSRKEREKGGKHGKARLSR